MNEKINDQKRNKPFPTNKVMTFGALLLFIMWAGYKMRPIVVTYMAASSFGENYNENAQISADLRQDPFNTQVLISFALDTDRSEAVRCWSLITLREARRVSIKKLSPLVRDKNPQVALQAATALAFVNSDLGRSHLQKSISTPAVGDDLHHQFEAARAMFHLGYGSRVISAQYQLLAQGDAGARQLLMSLMTMEGGEAKKIAEQIRDGSLAEPELLLWWKDVGLARKWTMACEACIAPPVLHDPMPAPLTRD